MTQEQRARQVAMAAGAAGRWDAETAAAFVAQADTMTEDEMTFWEQAAQKTEDADRNFALDNPHEYAEWETDAVVMAALACPTCGENREDWLIVSGWDDRITCASCGAHYRLRT